MSPGELFLQEQNLIQSGVLWVLLPGSNPMPLGLIGWQSIASNREQFRLFLSEHTPQC